MSDGVYLLERIQRRCTDDAGCWVWNGTAQKGVMPMINVAGKIMGTRRAAFIAANGEVKEGNEIVANCETLLCVNPEHLQQITAKARRRIIAERRNAHPVSAALIAKNRAMFAKLDIEKVRHIRSCDERSDVLAAMYGVSRTRINDVRAGKAWPDQNPFAGLGAR